MASVGTMDDEVHDAIVAVVSKRTGAKADLISTGSRLREDLGLDGDDADEALWDLNTHYGIDLFESFDFSTYFYGEPTLANLFGRTAPRQSLTVGELANFVREAIGKG